MLIAITTVLATAALLPINGRLHGPGRSRIACACLQDISLQYELDTEELIIDDGSDVGGPLTAYVTQEQPREDGERVDRALILLSDASGWQDVQTRRLADRLAIFCSCVVLVPDLLRGEAACTQAQDDEAYASWLSALPPERVDRDVRDCVVMLRADRRIRGPLAMLGLGLGGGQAVRANAGLELAGTALICPRHYERATLAAAKAPTIALFDGDARALDEARDALLGPGAAPSTGEPPLSTLRVPELRASQHVRSGPIGHLALPHESRLAAWHICFTGLVGALTGAAGCARPADQGAQGGAARTAAVDGEPAERRAVHGAAAASAAVLRRCGAALQQGTPWRRARAGAERAGAL